ncbi:MAG: hypothetical protein RL497_21 [Pseudomonadota bacterium]|jgi:predicted nucleotidyltransferase
MPNTLHLPEQYRTQVCTLLQQYIPHARVLAYGSRVKGDCYEASDLDLVAHLSGQEKNTYVLGDLKDAFTESNLPILVQILDWDAIPESFREEINACYVELQTGIAGE